MREKPSFFFFLQNNVSVRNGVSKKEKEENSWVNVFILFQVVVDPCNVSEIHI